MHEKAITSKSLRLELNKLPINWSELSILFAGRVGIISGKHRDPIPEQYFNKLQKFADSLKWVHENN